MFVRQVPSSFARYHYYAEYLMLTWKIRIDSITAHIITLFHLTLE